MCNINIGSETRGTDCRIVKVEHGCRTKFYLTSTLYVARKFRGLPRPSGDVVRVKGSGTVFTVPLFEVSG